MGWEDWKTPDWLRRRRARRARRRVSFAQALAATQFVTVASIVDLYHDAPREAANDDLVTRRLDRGRPPLTLVSGG